jgi:glycosyltransferase involved in cell wall biosynthesis
MKISVVIPHLNQPEMLVRCLASLAEGERKPDEIFVVDNGSSELPVGICAGYPEVVLLQELEPGPGPARNKGVTAATGDVLAFIDSDCIAGPAWLAEAERAMVDPAAQILGGDVRIELANPPKMTALEAYESIYAYRMDRYIAREGFTGTGNLVVRRDVLDAVGPFKGLSVAEDRDWGQRATALGYQIRYVAKMRVYHPARKTFAEIFLKLDRHAAHDFERTQSIRHGYLKWGVKLLAMGISPVAEIPRIAGSDRISGTMNRIRAFTALTRIRFYRARLMGRFLFDPRLADLAQGWNRNQGS